MNSKKEPIDQRDLWPVDGVSQTPPPSSAVVDQLHALGYRALFVVTPIASDEDKHQDHLNNSAAVRMFNELRIAYVASRLSPDWPRHLRRENLIVVVRELHVEYQSEAQGSERFIGATRLSFRRGKSVLIEQALVEIESGRPVARAWVVQLLLGPTGVQDWPDFYWDLVATSEGAPLVELADSRPSWGPGSETS